MGKKFKFIVWEEEDWKIYRAIEIVETGIYRVEWYEEHLTNFTYYLPEYVEKYLDEGDWIIVE